MSFKASIKQVKLENWSCGLIENWKLTKGALVSQKLQELNSFVCMN